MYLDQKDALEPQELLELTEPQVLPEHLEVKVLLEPLVLREDRELLGLLDLLVAMAQLAQQEFKVMLDQLVQRVLLVDKALQARLV